MTKTLKEKWIKALASGKYKKTTGLLVRDNSYCCLGVLGSICGLKDQEMKKMSEWEDSQGQMLSDSFLEKVKLDNIVAMRFAGLNDRSDTFEPIIKIIGSQDI